MASATVLVVDDERGLADLYSEWLDAEYTVHTAYSGESALSKVDDNTDVVLLDRRMPDRSGDEVLEEIRSRKLRCHVAMVTAVEPDFDILEMGFDDYIIKPIDRDDLLTVVERMQAFEDLGPGAQEYYSKVSKKSALEGQKGANHIAGNPEVDALNDEIEAYSGVITTLADRAISAKQRELQRGTDPDAPAELQKWRDRLDSMDAGDSLYQVAKERIEELEADLPDHMTGGGSSGGGKSAAHQFLEAVAEDFIAEGLWLEPTVKRALNLILHDRDREPFIINRQPIEKLAEQGASSKFEASQEVRNLARKELESAG